MATGVNAINENTVGISGFNGTSFPGTAATQYALQVGGATSSTLNNLAVGSAGQVLQSGGAAANPAWSTATYPATAGTSNNILTSDGTNFVSSAPPWVLLSTQTASSSASISFTNIGSYFFYLLIFKSLIPATDGASLRMQVSNDNGSTWGTSGYLSGINTAPYNSATWTNSNSTANFILTGPLDNGSANSTAHGWVQIYNIPGNLGHIAGQMTGFDNTAGTVVMGNITGRGGVSGQNAYKLLMSSGNITNGKFWLYGSG